jgi:hypothetical protein
MQAVHLPALAAGGIKNQYNRTRHKGGGGNVGHYELDEEHTRFVLRIRIRLAPLMQLLSFFPISDLGQFLMVRWMVLGIMARAESLAAQRET